MKIKISMLLLLVASYGLAQKRQAKDTSTMIHQPNRIEFEMDDYGNNFHLISGEETGILVVQETENRVKEGYNWLFHGVDTALTNQWTRIISIAFDSYMIGYEFSAGKYYLLFNVNPYRSEDMKLYVIDGVTGDHEVLEINTVFPIQLTFFEVISDNVVLAGYTNYRPVLFTYNLEEQKPRVVPGFYDNNSDILDVIIDDDAGIFSVVQKERLNNRRYTITTKTFTASGDLIQSNTVEPEERKNLVDGASTSFLGGFQYIAGTYAKNASQYSRGLYLAKFVNGRQQFIKYYDYGELNNFFGYLNKRKQQRVKERIARKKSKGKKPKFSYRLLVHEIIQQGDEYLMIAEAYYPRYSNNSLPSAYGYISDFRLMSYKYTHAIVVSFDRLGNAIWDNSFEINDVEEYGLDECVVVSNYGDKTVLMYLEENTLRSKVIQGNEILEGKTFSPVKLTFDHDEVRNKNPEVEGLKKWYGRTMYAFGEQRIRNEAGDGGRYYRRVFYINKIQYDLHEITN